MLPLEKRLGVAIPRVALGRFPTPVETHPELARELGFASLSIKREDKSALDGPGGNKLRALEWILPGAGSWIVSMGGYGSTYVAALSFYAQRRQQKVAVGLFPQPWVGSVPVRWPRPKAAREYFLPVPSGNCRSPYSGPGDTRPASVGRPGCRQAVPMLWAFSAESTRLWNSGSRWERARSRNPT